ncbi:hypothetical protein D3C80_268400 [compost metagenome]
MFLKLGLHLLEQLLVELLLVLRRLAKQLDNLQAVQERQCAAVQRFFVGLLHQGSGESGFLHLHGHHGQRFGAGVGDLDQFQVSIGRLLQYLGMARQFTLQLVAQCQFASVFR